MLLNVCRNISLPPPLPAPSSLYSLKNIWRLADKNVSASMLPRFVKTNNKAQEEEREKHFPLAPSAIWDERMKTQPKYPFSFRYI